MRGIFAIAFVLLKSSGRTRATFIYNVLYPMIYFFLFFVVYGTVAPPAILFVGLATTVIIAGGLYSLSMQIVFLREIGILRTFYGAPIKSWHFLLGQALNVYVIIMLVLLLQGSLAVIYFNLSVPSMWLLALAEISLGILLMTSVGVLVSCLVGSIQSSQTITRILFYLCIGLSGSILPLHVSSQLFSRILQWTPPRLIYRSMKNVFVGGSTRDAMLIGLVMAVMAFLFFAISAWLFKWDRRQQVKGFNFAPGSRSTSNTVGANKAS